jgi:hypothetical protein
MRPFCIEGFAGETRYEMAVVVAHRGCLATGHYVAYVKVGQMWFLFNDSAVTPAKDAAVRAAFSAGSWIESDPFLAYLVGYVRVDCAEEMQVVSTRSPVFAANFIWPHKEVKKMWGENDQTISELADHEGKFVLFIRLPTSQKLIGPVPMEQPAADFTLPGIDIDFVFVPTSEADCPVFFSKADDGAIELLSKNHLFQQYSDAYSFRVDEIPVSEASEIEAGSTIHGIVKTPITLTIDNKSFTVEPTCEYSGLQSILAGDNHPSQIVIFSGNVLLAPGRFPTARHLSRRSPLRSVALDLPITVYSLSLFDRITIEFFDVDGTQTTRSDIWIPRLCRVEYLQQRLPAWFCVPGDRCFLISEYSEGAIVSLLSADWRVPTRVTIRVDCYRQEVPTCARDFRGGAAIEVRQWMCKAGRKRSRTLGLKEVDDGVTVEQFVAAVDAGTPVKVGTIADGAGGLRELKPNDVLLERIQALGGRTWGSRPVLVLQMDAIVGK